MMMQRLWFGLKGITGDVTQLAMTGKVLHTRFGMHNNGAGIHVSQ